MRYFYLVLLMGCLVSCQDKGAGDAEDGGSSTEQTTLPPGHYRYCFVTNDDTAILELSVSENRISGTFMNHYFGQERNDGNFENARLSGDTLFTDYRYFSGGVQYLREVVFLIRDGQAQEGYGPSEMRGEKRVFPDVQALSFNGPLLSSATCGGNVDKIR